MTSIKLTDASLRSGVWEGVLTVGAPPVAPPVLEVSHLGQPVPGVRVTPVPDQPDRFIVQLPIPTELLHDGVQSFVVSDSATGDVLETFSIIAGHPLDRDLRAEIDLLRAELDMLKQAFRRHCSEGN